MKTCRDVYGDELCKIMQLNPHALAAGLNLDAGGRPTRYAPRTETPVMPGTTHWVQFGSDIAFESKFPRPKPNVRFWSYSDRGWAKLTLEPGQVLVYCRYDTQSFETAMKVTTYYYNDVLDLVERTATICIEMYGQLAKWTKVCTCPVNALRIAPKFDNGQADIMAYGLPEWSEVSGQ